MPLCRPGNQNSTATPYTTHLGDTITIFCPFSHCCEGCTIDHYNNQSGEYDEISRGACRTTIHISDYDDGGWYKCGCSSGCSNDAVNVTQCVHNVQGEIMKLLFLCSFIVSLHCCDSKFLK